MTCPVSLNQQVAELAPQFLWQPGLCSFTGQCCFSPPLGISPYFSADLERTHQSFKAPIASSVRCQLSAWHQGARPAPSSHSSHSSKCRLLSFQFQILSSSAPPIPARQPLMASPWPSVGQIRNVQWRNAGKNNHHQRALQLLCGWYLQDKWPVHLPDRETWFLWDLLSLLAQALPSLPYADKSQWLQHVTESLCASLAYRRWKKTTHF